jgi:hypothetical protein
MFSFSVGSFYFRCKEAELNMGDENNALIDVFQSIGKLVS